MLCAAGLLGVLTYAWSTSRVLRTEADRSLAPLKYVDGAEVKRHTTLESCWVVVNGAVWDVTDFLATHPGGSEAVLRVAGTDASRVFNPIHPSNTLKEGLRPEHCLGLLDPNGETVEMSLPEVKRAGAGGSAEEEQVLPLSSMATLDDFERMARLGLSDQALAYYTSTADGGFTYERNRAAWSDVMLRPRVLVDVTDVDLSGKILGQETSLPIYISPAALAKLAHEDGEVALCRGAYRAGIVQCISSNASCALEEIHDAAQQDQPLFFQLYVNREPDTARQLLQKLCTLERIKAVYLTVDAPVGGNRVLAIQASRPREAAPADSTSEVMFRGVSPALTWQSLHEIRAALPKDIPIMIKGIATVEDAILAHRHGATGIVLSNHGGRQLDTAPPPLLTLLEIRKHAPWLIKGVDGDAQQGLEVHIDGGIRRGTDVIKALALGATACGLGRPFLYALANDYGTDGVVKVTEIIKREMAIGMRLLGVTNLKDLRRQGHRLVNTKALDGLIPDADLSSL